jgi:hypothetical protein
VNDLLGVAVFNSSNQLLDVVARLYLMETFPSSHQVGKRLVVANVQ